MKKLFPFMVIIISLLLSSCQPNKQPIPQNESTTPNPQSAVNEAELRGVWISCYDHISAAGKSREEYKTETDRMFRTIAACGLNTAFVHLRAFSDAFYESEIFPYSSYIAGNQGEELLFDPFEVMLESAKVHKISVHGWINPFRISTQTDISLLSEKNPAKKILDGGNKNGEICILENGIYYNPSCASNHKLILDGVKEIITKYDIDGIHIDDYFYPSADEKTDKIQYSEYKSSGGSLPLYEWRKINVNAFISALYSAVKAADSTLTVSISPAAEIQKNKTELYADCEQWLAGKGYADLIIPQIYYGFEHEKLAFEPTLSSWSGLARNPEVRLACGIAAYKCGKTDNYAGAGTGEWQECSDMLAKQLKVIRSNKSYGGFVVFSYSDLIREDCKAEIQNLKDTIKTGK